MTTPTEAPHANEEYSLPCAEALLAGTLALMTGYALGACDAHRDAMGRKIVANLQNLAQLETLTPHFRTMLWNLQVRWATQSVKLAATHEATERDRPADPGRTLWHAAPSRCNDRGPQAAPRGRGHRAGCPAGQGAAVATPNAWVRRNGASAGCSPLAGRLRLLQSRWRGCGRPWHGMAWRRVLPRRRTRMAVCKSFSLSVFQAASAVLIRA